MFGAYRPEYNIFHLTTGDFSGTMKSFPFCVLFLKQELQRLSQPATGVKGSSGNTDGRGEMGDELVSRYGFHGRVNDAGISSERKWLV